MGVVRNAIVGTITVLGGMLFLALMAFLRLIWMPAKLILIAGILVGAFTQVIKQAPTEWPLFAFKIETLFVYLALVFDTVMNSWMTISVAALFLWMWSTYRNANKIRSDVTQMKIGVVAFLNYLEIEVETAGMKEAEEKGLFKSVWEAWKTNLALWLIFGDTDLTDDTLSAMAIRNGAKVTLSGDIRNQMEVVQEN